MAPTEGYMQRHLRRLQEREIEDFPLTVWQTECLADRSLANTKAGTRILQPNLFQSLRVFGPLCPIDPLASGFFAEECRYCTGRFVFRKNGAEATILIGNPGSSVKYNAISYVWGDVRQLRLYCRCGMKKEVPISSPRKFCNLLSLAATNEHEGTWLDALSIDQDSDSDKKSLIEEMGHIYKSAQSVLVLLPSTDAELFGSMKELNRHILEQDGMGLMHIYKERPYSSNFRTYDLSHAMKINMFLWTLDIYKRLMKKSVYFKRAWTFQEWALARDVSIALEDGAVPQDVSEIVLGLKIAVIRTAVRMAWHRTRFRNDGAMFNMQHADLPAFLEEIKSLFPHEDIFLSRDEIDWNELDMDYRMPTMSGHNYFGLRLSGHSQTPNQHFRTRLGIMLNAFTITNRNARYPADQVACWASMCNLKFDYNKEDSILLSLRKAIHAIRLQGVGIFNFQAHPNAGSADADVITFYDYARDHEMGLPTNKVFTFAAPSFTGFADFETHLMKSLVVLPIVAPKGQPVSLRRVLDADIQRVIPVEDVDAVAKEFDRIHTGYWNDGCSDGNPLQIFRDLKTVTRDSLHRLDMSQREQFVLVTASFRQANVVLQGSARKQAYQQRQHEQGPDQAAINSFRDMSLVSPTRSPNVLPIKVEPLEYGWAICRRDLICDDVFIAREGINGSLVLIQPTGQQFSIVAYLCGIDQMCGAYLLPTNSQGEVAIRFRPMRRPDREIAVKGGASVFDERYCIASLDLETVELQAQ